MDIYSLIEPEEEKATEIQFKIGDSKNIQSSEEAVVPIDADIQGAIKFSEIPN